MSRSPSWQRGATLIVSLIMLMLITLMAVTSFRLLKGNLQIVGNLQQRNEGLAAAQGAIEQVISSTQFTTTPANAVPNPCLAANTTCVDVNGDGVTDVSVAVAINCVAVVPVAISSLNPNSTNDQNCVGNVNQTFGTPGSSSNTSNCTDTVWDTQATATDSVTNAQYVVNEGVAVRLQNTPTCP